MVKLIGLRFGVPTEEESDTVEDAVGMASYWREWNLASPDHIEDESGAVLMDFEALRVAMDEYERRQ